MFCFMALFLPIKGVLNHFSTNHNRFYPKEEVTVSGSHQARPGAT